MKDGKKKAAKTNGSPALPAAAPLRPAIPYPPDVSPTIAEEARIIPHFGPRELEVASWIAEGKTDPEIARITGLGLQTVKTHVKALLHKTQLENRNAFMAWAWRDRLTVERLERARLKAVKYK